MTNLSHRSTACELGLLVHSPPAGELCRREVNSAPRVGFPPGHEVVRTVGPEGPAA